MATITFLTGHFYLSQRRAGFHNLADAAHAMGHRVNFVTIAYSLFSFLRRDYRTRIPNIERYYNRLVNVREGLYAGVYYTLLHPMNLILPPLNALVSLLADCYGQNLKGLEEPFRETDIFVFESCSGLYLFDRVKALAPQAKVVYRVSDDIRILGSTPPCLVEHERKIAGRFDTVSVPSSVMQGMFPGVAMQLDRHGLNKGVYDACVSSPYGDGGCNVIFVGTGYLDQDFLKSCAVRNRDCRFHVIGPIDDAVHEPNVRFYGEMPFEKTVPYVKFADVGLATRTYRKGFSSTLTDSLKIIQYRYCGLPIVSPDFIDLRREGVFYYKPGDAASCDTAFRQALTSGKNSGYANEVRTWAEVARSVLHI